MIKLGILGSTRGSNLLALIQAMNQGTLDAHIEIVVSNKEDSGILSRAREHGLNAKYLPPDNMGRVDYDNQLSSLLALNHVDLVVLIGYMRILSKEFVNQWPNKIINVHPSLLPLFAGLMDKQVHQAVLDSKHTESGCSIHYVTDKVDAGPIIVQKKCPVFPDDSVESLKARIQQLEGVGLIDSIKMIQSERYL